MEKEFDDSAKHFDKGSYSMLQEVEKLVVFHSSWFLCHRTVCVLVYTRACVKCSTVPFLCSPTLTLPVRQHADNPAKKKKKKNP